MYILNFNILLHKFSVTFVKFASLKRCTFYILIFRLIKKFAFSDVDFPHVSLLSILLYFQMRLVKFLTGKPVKASYLHCYKLHTLKKICEGKNSDAKTSMYHLKFSSKNEHFLLRLLCVGSNFTFMAKNKSISFHFIF